MIAPVQTKADVVSILRQNAQPIQDLGVERIGVFGSFVQQRQKAVSDVDVLVEFRPGEKSFDRFVELAELLEGLFGRRVELVTLESLSPYLGPKILAQVEYVAFGR